jgi:uncharacterized protein YfdQ (DUF2303 family)
MDINEAKRLLDKQGDTLTQKQIEEWLGPFADGILTMLEAEIEDIEKGYQRRLSATAIAVLGVLETATEKGNLPWAVDHG